MALRMTVLGFAAAAPLEGACSSYVVSDGERHVMLDCGPGALERAWRLRLLDKLDAIVISHMHADHVLDLLLLAGELVRARLADRRPLLYVPQGDGPRVLDALAAPFDRGGERVNRFRAAFQVREYVPADTVQIGTLTLTFAPTAHTKPCCAIRATDGRSAIVYGADGRPSQTLERLATGADLLVLEATFAEDAALAAAHGHMTAQQAGELASRAGAKQLLLTHLQPGAGESLRRLAKRAFAGRVDLAREGLTYDLGAVGARPLAKHELPSDIKARGVDW